MVGKWVEEHNPEVGTTWWEFDKFQWKMDIWKINLKHSCKYWNSVKRIGISNQNLVGIRAEEVNPQVTFNGK